MDKVEEIKLLKMQVEQYKEKFKKTQSLRKNSKLKSQIVKNKQYESNHTGVWINHFKCAICVYKFSS